MKLLSTLRGILSSQNNDNIIAAIQDLLHCVKERDSPFLRKIPVSISGQKKWLSTCRANLSLCLHLTCVTSSLGHWSTFINTSSISIGTLCCTHYRWALCCTTFLNLNQTKNLFLVEFFQNVCWIMHAISSHTSTVYIAPCLGKGFLIAISCTCPSGCLASKMWHCICYTHLMKTTLMSIRLQNFIFDNRLAPLLYNSSNLHGSLLQDSYLHQNTPMLCSLWCMILWVMIGCCVVRSWWFGHVDASGLLLISQVSQSHTCEFHPILTTVCSFCFL